MYEILCVAIGALISGIFWLWHHQKQSNMLYSKDHPFIADSYVSIAQQGDIIVIIGTEDLYARKNALQSLYTMCNHLKEKDVEIILVPESFVKQAWIIPHDLFLPEIYNK